MNNSLRDGYIGNGMTKKEIYAMPRGDALLNVISEYFERRTTIDIHELVEVIEKYIKATHIMRKRK